MRLRVRIFVHQEIYDAFTQYKYQIPTCGAMLLNPGATKVLLVKSWHGKTWGFPKGKIDRDEDKASCAMREVLEEVGYDISALIDPDAYIELQAASRLSSLLMLPRPSPTHPFCSPHLTLPPSSRACTTRRRKKARSNRTCPPTHPPY